MAWTYLAFGVWVDEDSDRGTSDEALATTY